MTQSELKKIYILDDDKDIRKLTQNILKEEYDCEVFSNTSELKTSLLENLPDLFILDVILKEGTILNFLEYRSRSSVLSKIPVIIFSALKNKKLINKILVFDIQEYLIKPFAPRHLQNTVQRIFIDKNASDFMFEELGPIEISVPIIFREVSEISILAEGNVRLVAETEYNIQSDYFDKYHFISNKLQSPRNSFLSQETNRFNTPFRVRGANENFLSKIRAANP